MKELEVYQKKLERLKELKVKEPDNRYHDWDKEIAQIKHNIIECISELNLKTTD